jgi:pyridoxal phosphate enzyme (YggS family)
MVRAGCQDLGESRPQELWAKAEELQSLAVRWHLIGHLQRNKIRRTWPLVSLFHSIDSQRLLASLNEEVAAEQKQIDALLEVNISGDAAKHGFAPNEIEPLLEQLSNYPAVRIIGLMTMSGLESSQTEAEREFAQLRQLRDRLAPRAPTGVSLQHLSMGMSEDFEAAIRQGATFVRIGSALTEGLDLEQY